jgi:hypothetical protein
MMDFGACSKFDKTVTLYNLEIEAVPSKAGGNIKDHHSSIKKYTFTLENLKNLFY